MKRIILAGKAASGKDYFKDHCRNIGMIVDTSYTTRQKRELETNGLEYNFVNEEEWKDIIFKEFVEFNGNKYGTSLESWNTSELFIMERSAIESLTKEERKNSVIIYFDIDKEIRKKRMMKRSDSKSIESRIKFDDDLFNNFTDFDIHITNPEYSCYTIIRYAKSIKI